MSNEYLYEQLQEFFNEIPYEYQELYENGVIISFRI